MRRRRGGRKRGKEATARVQKGGSENLNWGDGHGESEEEMGSRCTVRAEPVDLRDGLGWRGGEGRGKSGMGLVSLA